jgi:hypothetical protein
MNRYLVMAAVCALGVAAVLVGPGHLQRRRF